MTFSGQSLKGSLDVGQVLTNGLAHKPDSLALVSLDSCWTWRELEKATAQLASSYLDLGLQPGDRIASLMPNCCELVIHYLACVRAGLVLTPLNYRYMAPEIDHALSLSDASALLVHAERKGDLADCTTTDHLKFGIITYLASDNEILQFEHLLTNESNGSIQINHDSTVPAFIFFTSGSTGSPKGVCHNRTSLGWIAASTIKGLEFKSSDIFLAASSLSHEGGVGFSFAALLTGAQLVIAGKNPPNDLLSLLRQYRPTVTWTLPVALSQLIHEPGIQKSDFVSLRLVCTGGDKAPAELERTFKDMTGFEMRETYGMTEVGSATINPPSGINKPGSIGSLSPGYQGQIRDERGKELPAGQAGRLWIKSPCQMVGYWKNPTATAEVVRSGWLDTGDIMIRDEDDYLWFAGRKKQIIVHDGSNICPQEVEGALLEHPAVNAAGVIGIHDPLHGENVRAYISLKKGASRPGNLELIEFTRARIGYKSPEEIIFIDEMPLSPAGKIDRTRLKQQAESHCALNI